MDASLTTDVQTAPNTPLGRTASIRGRTPVGRVPYLTRMVPVCAPPSTTITPVNTTPPVTTEVSLTPPRTHPLLDVVVQDSGKGPIVNSATVKTEEHATVEQGSVTAHMAGRGWTALYASLPAIKEASVRTPTPSTNMTSSTAYPSGAVGPTLLQE